VLLFTGYVLNVLLARYLGPESYGIYGLVMSVLLWIEIVVINGLPYAVQKFISSDESRSGAILWTAGQMQFVVAAVLFGLSFALAPFIANFFKDARLVIWFRVAFIDILVYGFFHIFSSYQNGLRHFGKQALLLIVYGLSKLGFVIFFIFVTRTLTGVFLANVAGSIVGLIMSLLFLGKDIQIGAYDRLQLIRFAFPSLLYFLMMNLLLYIDLWVVNYFLGKTTGGYYVAASTIARIPYFVVFGLSATVLPTLSNKLKSGVLSEAKTTIQSSFKLFLLMALPLGIVITLFPRDIIVFIYSVVYIQSGSILPIFVWGMIFLAFFSILTTIINADNAPHISFWIAVLTVLIDVICNVKLVPVYGIIGGAFATTATVGFGVLIAILYVYRRFRFLLDPRSSLRIGAAGLVLLGAIKLSQGFHLHFLLGGLIGLILYGLVLLMLKVIVVEDLYDFSLFRRNNNHGSESLN
jgi:O-antigen/teichoic acid export membrane protein